MTAKNFLKSAITALLVLCLVASCLVTGLTGTLTAKAESTGTVTYVYAGEGSYPASAIGFWVTGICVNGNWPAAGCNITALDSSYTVTTTVTTYNDMPAVVVSADTSVCTELWANIWVDGSSISKDGNQLLFDDTVYYIYDDSSITTTGPSTDDDDEEEEVTPANEYTVTVHVYGQDATIGAGFANASASAWSSYWQQDAALSGDWATTVYTLSDTKVYTDFEAQLIVNGEWTSPKYTMGLTDNSATMWIVPKAGTCYNNEADALAAAADPATSSTIIFHYKKTSGTMGGWVVGTWYTTAVNGGWGSKDTVFTYEDDWGYVAIVKYSAVVNEIGFKFHRRAKIDGVANDWYKEDGGDRTVTLNNGFAEVWITQGKNAVLYECPEGATVFNASTATKFKNYRYLLVNTPAGEEAELVFHYYRADEAYDNWTIGIWAEVMAGTWKDEQIQQGALDEYNAITYTVDLSKWPATEIGFSVNYNNWASKDVEADRYVVVSDVKAGDVKHVYLYQNDPTIYFEPQTEVVIAEAETGINADVVFHYNRTEGDYEGWMVGLWCEKEDGTWVNDNVAFDGTDADGNATVTIDLAKFPSDTLGFKLNQNNWAAEDGGDRSIDISNLTDGQIIDVYVYQGDNGVYFEPQVSEEPVEEEPVVEESATDVVEESATDVVVEPTEETEEAGGCNGCNGCNASAFIPVFFAGMFILCLNIFKKRG